MNQIMIAKQRLVCNKYGASFLGVSEELKVGISLNIKDGALPINGLRYQPEEDTTGWFIWGGEELPEDPDFFVPLCVEHLREWCPQVLKYLGLPPGWRFLLAKKYEDVWEDKALISQ